MMEQLEDLKEKCNALKKFGRTKHTTSFGGFATYEEAMRISNAIETVTKGKKY